MKTNTIFDRLVELACVIFLVTMFIVVSIQVFSRYLLPVSPAWTEELGRYLLLWLVAIGSGVYWKSGGYRAVVDVLTSIFPKWLLHTFNFLSGILTLGFLAVLAVTTLHLILENTDVKTPALSMPVSYIYLGILVLALLMFYFFIPFTISQIKEMRTKNSTVKDE